jgi:hypothetical protein
MDAQVLVLDSALDEIRNSLAHVGRLVGLSREVEPGCKTYIVGRAVSDSGDTAGLHQVGVWSRGAAPVSEAGPISLLVDGERMQCFLSGTGRPQHEVSVEVIRYMTGFHERNHGLIDPSVFTGQEVLIVGNGSVGGKLAQDLTHAGVEKFTLIDPDHVSLANLSRCEFDLFDLGLPKPVACRNRMLAINPRVQVRAFTEDIRKMDSDVLDAAIGRASVAVFATDNPIAQRIGNGRAYHRVPALYPGIYPQGTGGEIIITIPEETACFECVLKGVLSQQPPGKGAWDYSTDGQTKPEPALIADIQSVVTHTTKLVLALLSRGKPGSRFKDYVDPKLNVLFIGNEKDWIFEYPFQTAWASSEVNPDCMCREGH